MSLLAAVPDLTNLLAAEDGGDPGKYYAASRTGAVLNPHYS
jgi:hypothetical protein